MTFAVIFTSLLIALSGYIVNEKNADVLLAGYNTMSKDEKNRFDLIARTREQNYNLFD